MLLSLRCLHIVSYQFMAKRDKMFQYGLLSTSHVNCCRMTFQNYNLFCKAFSHKKREKEEMYRKGMALQ